jgi:hypothetical protein
MKLGERLPRADPGSSTRGSGSAPLFGYHKRWGINMSLYMLEGSPWSAPVPSCEVHLPTEQIQRTYLSHGEIHPEWLQPVW